MPAAESGSRLDLGHALSQEAPAKFVYRRLLADADGTRIAA